MQTPPTRRRRRSCRVRSMPQRARMAKILIDNSFSARARPGPGYRLLNPLLGPALQIPEGVPAANLPGTCQVRPDSSRHEAAGSRILCYSKQPQVLPTGLFGFFGTVIREPDIRAGELNGPDAYFFVRFIKFLAIVLLPFWILTWAVIMPIDAIGPNNNDQGVDQVRRK